MKAKVTQTPYLADVEEQALEVVELCLGDFQKAGSGVRNGTGCRLVCGKRVCRYACDGKSALFKFWCIR